MGRTIQFLLSLGVLIAGMNIAASQGVTIDSNDVKAVYSPGNRIIYHHDTVTTNVDIRPAGNAGTWDFSGFGTNFLETRKCVSLGSTPNAVNYPQATHALLDTAFSKRLYGGSFLGWATINSNAAYYYFRIGAKLEYFGLRGVGLGYLDLNPGTGIDFSARWDDVPSSAELDLPVQYLKTWSCNYVDSLAGTAYNLPIFGTQTFYQAIPYSVDYLVDGYGSLKLPIGEPQEALRIRKTSLKYNAIVEVWYLFVARNGATVQMLLRDSLATSGVVAVDSIRWSGGVVDISVPIQLASFTGIRLDQISVILEWRTLTETDNLGFYIQRKGSEDADFADLPGSFVEGHGTTVVPHSYSYRDASGNAQPYWYRLKQVDLDGTMHFSDAVLVDILSGVSDVTPGSYGLSQNYPNPFNPSTYVGYSVGVVSGEPFMATRVRLAVYDLLGREVALLVNEQKLPGSYEVRFDAADLPSGVYLCRMTAGEFSATTKLVLMR